MPLSSFLLKPMQRITRYPLLIKSVSTLSDILYENAFDFGLCSKRKKSLISSRGFLEECGELFPVLTSIFVLVPPHFVLHQILENTPENHPDHSNLKLALERAEELCSQVNEGVREKENSDRLEWIQSHVQCEGLAEVTVLQCSVRQCQFVFGLGWPAQGSLLLWRYLKPAWMLSCVTYCREAALAGGWTRGAPEVPSIHYSPVIQ